MLHLFRRKQPVEATIGSIAIWLGFIDTEQLSAAINAKGTASRERLLGEILVAHGAMTRAQLERVLTVQRGMRGGIDNYASMLNGAVAMAHEGLDALGTKVEELMDSAQRLTRSAAAKK